MTRAFVLKTLRLFIGISVFIGITQMVGVDYRQSQEMFYMLMGIILFGLILDNIWLTLFLWISVYLFTLSKFAVGFNYVVNIWLGCTIYYLTKLSFKRKHIDFYLNCVLWLVAINLLMAVLQCFGLDFVFWAKEITAEGATRLIDNNDPSGFMGYKAALGILCAMAIPILGTRGHKWSIPMALTMFVPIYISRASICMVGGIIGLLFVLWYRIDKRIWVSSVVGLALLGGLYVAKVDMPMGHMDTRTNQWKLALRDCTIHPVLGWGIDSFRNITEKKKHIYAMNYTQKGNAQHFDYWDNAHNLYIQLWFEWGILGLLCLIGYIRQCVIWFGRSVKDPNTLAVTSAMLVFYIVSIAQFPMFLARTACFIIPMFALAEIAWRE